MRYAYDSEFLEDGRTIELISLAMVAEDGREFYVVNRDAPWRRIKKHEWLVANVVPGLPKLHGDARLHYARRGPLGLIDWQSGLFCRRDRIGPRLVDFLGNDENVQLWADYGAYDHVVLMQLFGPMVDKPSVLPYFTHDIQQAAAADRRVTLPPDPVNAHNALADARHAMECVRLLTAGPF